MSLFYLVIYSFEQSIYISASFVENFSSDPEEDKEKSEDGDDVMIVDVRSTYTHFHHRI